MYLNWSSLFLSELIIYWIAKDRVSAPETTYILPIFIGILLLNGVLKFVAFQRIHKKGIVVVIGGSSGLGKETAIKLHRDGFHVIFTERKKGSNEHLINESMRAVQLDLNSVESINAAIQDIRKILKFWNLPLVGLFNNAGVGISCPSEVTSHDRWMWLMRSNFFGHVEIIRHFIPDLRESVKKGYPGRIAITGSISAFVPAKYFAMYTVSKAALLSYSKCLRYELKPFGIQVAYIVLGGVATEIFDKGRTIRDELEKEISRDYNRHLYPKIPIPDEGIPLTPPAASKVAVEVADIFETRYFQQEYWIGRSAGTMYWLTTLSSSFCSEILNRTLRNDPAPNINLNLIKTQ